MTNVIQEKIRIGRCGDTLDPEESSLRFRYTPDSFKSVWDFTERLARFVSSYYNLFPLGRDYQSLLFIINEVLENAIKNNMDSSIPIEVTMCQNTDESILTVTNEVSERDYRSFMEYAIALQEANLIDLYRKILEDMAVGASAKGIGLVLLKKDQHVELGFEFIAGDGRYRVSVSARF